MKRYRYKKCYELKNMAKDKLSGKYASAVLICFLSFQIQYTLTLYASALLPVAQSSEGISVPIYIFRWLFSLALDCVLGVMNLGIDLFFLNIACGRRYWLGNLFYGFRHDSSKALTISGIYTLTGAVCRLPFLYLLYAYQSGGTEPAAAIALAAVIGICAYLAVSACMFLSFYLVLDFPDRSVREILVLSFRIMKGQKKRWLYMMCSFLPMIILCICTLGIGFLWLIPYMQMTCACLFLDIMNPKEETA